VLLFLTVGQRVVYDDTHQGLIGSCVKFSQTRS